VGALESIRADLGLSYAEAGLILTALGGAGIVGHGFKVAADFVDRRLLAGAGALVFGVCLFAFAVGHAFVVLLVAALVWGVAGDAFVAGCEMTLIDLYHDRLAPLLGRVNALGALGDLLGPLTLILAVALGVGWRGAFVLGGTLMLVYGIWVASRAFPGPGRPAKETSPIGGVLAVAGDRQMILLAVVAGLFGLLGEPFLGFTIAYLTRVRDLSPELATAIAGIAVAAGLAGFLAVPTFTARLASRPLLIASATVLGLGVAGLVVVPILPLLILAALAFGFSGAVFYAVLQATYIGRHPGRAGTSQAVVSTIGLFGVGVPALVGAVSDGFGLTAGLGIYAAVPPLILLLLVVGGP
jgi:MFS family permease